MMVLAFIGVFVAGTIAGITGMVLFAKHYANLTYDELGEAGMMLYEAGHNRVSTLSLCTDDGDAEVMVFEEM